MRHTPGRLHIAGRESRGLPHTLVAARTLLFRVYSEAYNDFDQETENARRLVACWNACEGVSTMDLEMDNAQFILALKERAALKGELMVVTLLLREAINVVMNVEAESADEDQMLANLIAKSNDAIKAVLTKHALPGAAG